MIPHLEPPQAPLQELLHGPMTATPPLPLRPSDLVYGLSTVSDGGRIVERHVFAAPAWSEGDRLSLRVDDAVLVAELATAATLDGSVVVRAGFVRLPYRWRRRVDLLLGDRVLLLANPSRNRLAIESGQSFRDLGEQAARDQHLARLVHLGACDPGVRGWVELDYPAGVAPAGSTNRWMP